jgi:Cu(I)/Ag(I) efflux system outer membrane protein
LTKNKDLRLAALGVLAARAEHGMAQSERLPRLEAEGGVSVEGGSGRETMEDYEVMLAAPAFEIDYLSRLGDLSRAALENYLGTVEAGRQTRLALVGSVAEAYLESLLAEEKVKITERDLAAFRSSRDFVEEMILAGGSDILELEQARALVAFAESSLEAMKIERVRANNALAFWISDFGDLDLPKATPLLKWPELTLPEGLRSEALLSRPDIAQAERALKAANANIGAARAAFFPSISLTGSWGLMSADLGTILERGTDFWSFGPRIQIPIFNAGRLKASLDLAEISKDIAVVEYEKAIINAFREVADALGVRASLAKRLKSQSQYLAIQRQVLELATNRHAEGTVEYPRILEAHREVLEAELELLEIKKERINNDISLYIFLGGGFDQEEPLDKPELKVEGTKAEEPQTKIIN